MGKDWEPYFWTAAAAAGAVKQGYDMFYTYAQPDGEADNNTMEQDTGLARRYVRKVTAGRKRFNPMKLLKSTFNHTEQCLGIKNDTSQAWSAKHAVSEYNPGTGGCVPICQFSNMLTPNGTYQQLPMHVYDLNTFVGGTDDTSVNYPVAETNVNTNINARAWKFCDTTNFAANSGLRPFIAMKSTNNDTLRWYINEPRTVLQDANPSVKVYRKGIAIDYMLYGNQKTATEFDIRVIKITDPMMCPDHTFLYDQNTSSSNEYTTFLQNWQNLVRAWTINPILRGIEPGPNPIKPWFKTVAKKRVVIGEQTGDIESVPTVQGKMYVRINEAQNYAWDNKAFTFENSYDVPPNVDDNGENNNFIHKPYYTSRYYLVIRALCPQNLVGSTSTTTEIPGADSDALLTALSSQWNLEGTSAAYTKYGPSYDLAIRTTFMTVNGN